MIRRMAYAFLSSEYVIMSLLVAYEIWAMGAAKGDVLVLNGLAAAAFIFLRMQRFSLRAASGIESSERT